MESEQAVPVSGTPNGNLSDSDRTFMRLALTLATRGVERGEVPVGAVLVDGRGEVLALSHNEVESRAEATAHAELIAIRDAMKKLADKRLTGSTLYVTLEPCAMCAGAISLARIGRLVFAAADPKGGGVIYGGKFFDQTTCHHRPTVVQDETHANESGDLLRGFFAPKRTQPRKNNERGNDRNGERGERRPRPERRPRGPKAEMVADQPADQHNSHDEAPDGPADT